MWLSYSVTYVTLFHVHAVKSCMFVHAKLLGSDLYAENDAHMGQGNLCVSHFSIFDIFLKTLESFW